MVRCSISVLEPHALEDEELAQEKFTHIIDKTHQEPEEGQNERCDFGLPDEAV